MHCPACKALNSSGRRYCGRCARALGAPCPVCQFVNEAGERYCGGCAFDLRPGQPAAAASAAVEALDPARTVPAPAPAFRSALELDELDDLIGSADRQDKDGEEADGATSQGDVDAFFRRLSQEGAVQIPGTAPGGTRPLKQGVKP